MMRIVNLGQTGLFVVLQGGALVTLEGRSHWNSAEDARRSAAAAKAGISDVVIHTAA